MLRSMTDDQVRYVVAAAGAAPSINNSQPWRICLRGAELELCAAPERALPAADPAARGLYISCGAALYNARLAIRSKALDPAVQLLPHPDYPFDVLAVLRATAGRLPRRAEREQCDCIWQRHTDRDPYSGTQIPAATVRRLRRAAAAEGGRLRMLSRAEGVAALALTAEAGQQLAHDELHQAELRRWIATGRDEGIPAAALPHRADRAPSPVRDTDLIAAAPGDRERRSYEAFPQLAVLTTAADEPADWLRAGQALQSLLLTATCCGVSASFLYQAIERDDMLGRDGSSWPWPEHCQMVIRLGYGTQPGRTPRRPVSDIMQPGRQLRVG
jgi:hypothetical protein